MRRVQGRRNQSWAAGHVYLRPCSPWTGNTCTCRLDVARHHGQVKDLIWALKMVVLARLLLVQLLALPLSASM